MDNLPSVVSLGLNDDDSARFGARIITERTASAILTNVKSRMIAGTVEFIADGDDTLGANSKA